MKILIVIGVAVAFKNLLHYLLDDESKSSSGVDTDSSERSSSLRIFQKEDLVNSKQLLLAVLGNLSSPNCLEFLDRDLQVTFFFAGNVYDVSKGEKHYKPGGSYDFFVGKSL